MVSLFFMIFHSHLDNSYHNRHDLSTIIIIILHHHDLKSIISFKQTRLFLTSYKNTVSARKQRLIQSNLFHHHGIRAELSQRTFDFSTHDHHNQASRILTEVLSIWVQVKWIPVFVISFMKNKLVYLFLHIIIILSSHST